MGRTDPYLHRRPLAFISRQVWFRNCMELLHRFLHDMQAQGQRRPFTIGYLPQLWSLPSAELIPFCWPSKVGNAGDSVGMVTQGSRTVEPQVPAKNLKRVPGWCHIIFCFVVNHAHSLLAESCLRCTTACDGWNNSSWSSCGLMVSRCIHCDHYVASPADDDNCDCMGDKGCRTCSGLGVVCTWFVWCMTRGDTWHLDDSWTCATRVLSFPIFGHGSQG